MAIARSLAVDCCRWFAVLLLAVGCWGWMSAPARAVEPVAVSPEFEAQVLQVIRDRPEAILESLQAYQQRLREEQSQIRAAALARLQTEPRTIIGDSPRLGAADLRLVLLEFSDFQCPFCGRAASTLKEFMRRHQAEVTLVFKHLPLSGIHPEARPAARAAWAAHQQGKFWLYHDRLFANQEELGDALYQGIARELGLKEARFERDRQRADAAINADIELARELGVGGTPFFALNGEVLERAVALEEFEAALERAEDALANPPAKMRR